MAEHTSRHEWVDRYVRNELTVNEITEFEQVLMESPAIQKDLETVLGLREALLLEPEQDIPIDGLLPESLSDRGNWQSMALAASLVLAAFSSGMAWKFSNDSADLQKQLNLLGQPRTDVLTVPVNIMRSAGSQAPDVIIQKPSGHSAILLDIELGKAALQQQALAFALVDEAGSKVLDWRTAAAAGGRVEVLLNSERIPATRVWLEIATSDGQLLERRLLEFR